MDLKTYSQGNSQIDLARKLGVTAGAVSQWVNGLTGVPAERCPAIEEATGGLVRCEDLRPDVRWDVLRANPAQAQAKPAQAATETIAVSAVCPAHAPDHFPKRGEARRHANTTTPLPAVFDDLNRRDGPGRREYNGGADLLQPITKTTVTQGV